MATYSGIVDLKGTIGKLSFYKRKGVNCVRRPGGFTKEKLHKDPRLRRVREHNAEFGTQSTASKSLRVALAPLREFWDGTLPNRLLKIGSRVTKLTTGVHGQRPLAFSRFKPILENLQLNKTRTLESVLALAIKSSPSITRNSSKLQLDIDIPNAVIPPDGSTHFRLVHALGVISDIEYEPAIEGFIPVAYQVDRMGAHSYSDYISLAQDNASITLETKLEVEQMPENATVVEVVGIEFYQSIASVYEPFTQGKAAMVTAAF